VQIFFILRFKSCSSPQGIFVLLFTGNSWLEPEKLSTWVQAGSYKLYRNTVLCNDKLLAKKLRTRW